MSPAFIFLGLLTASAATAAPPQRSQGFVQTSFGTQGLLVQVGFRPHHHWEFTVEGGIAALKANPSALIRLPTPEWTAALHLGPRMILNERHDGHRRSLLSLSVPMGVRLWQDRAHAFERFALARHKLKRVTARSLRAHQSGPFPIGLPPVFGLPRPSLIRPAISGALALRWSRWNPRGLEFQLEARMGSNVWFNGAPNTLLQRAPLMRHLDLRIGLGLGF